MMQNIIMISIIFPKNAKNNLFWKTGKYHDFHFSGDDSVTLSDSTQPEEPVGGKKKKIIRKTEPNLESQKNQIVTKDNQPRFTQLLTTK